MPVQVHRRLLWLLVKTVQLPILLL